MLSDIGDYIDRAIVEDPPFSVREGGFIQRGFSPEIDELNAIQTDGKSWIASVEQSERELTGIKGLKIGYNRVFGYYIEVTNSYKDQVQMCIRDRFWQVPSHFHRLSHKIHEIRFTKA